MNEKLLLFKFNDDKFKEKKHKLVDEIIEKYDVNKDGKIQKDEFKDICKHLATIFVIKFLGEGIIQKVKDLAEKDPTKKEECDDLLKYLEKVDPNFLKAVEPVEEVKFDLVTFENIEIDDTDSAFGSWEKFLPEKKAILEDKFKCADLDGNGELDLKEFKKDVKAFMNETLLISKGVDPEYKEVKHRIVEESLKKFDANKDGKIQKEEFFNICKYVTAIHILHFYKKLHIDIIAKLKEKAEKNPEKKAICEDMIPWLEKTDISFL